ncbi:MAG TPA: methylated-DNA--[protein]-cysteine S-methyltransferase [Chitinophagaceae bacterium]|nr:methylated-DNA--[protein]-cysteine S-methyltransferase [Chitinophagaceae bacterium]
MKVQNKFDFKKIAGWTKEYSPERLVNYLEPVYIKKQIDITITIMQIKRGYWSNIIIEAMTDEAYKGKVERLDINYSFYSSRFGMVMVASTFKGICYMGFAENETEAVNELKRRFPYSNYVEREDDHQRNALSVFDNPAGNDKEIRLHLKGTSFQLSIWKLLLQIPFGGLVSYASLTGDVKRSRAAGTAVGDNPIGYLVPCHRVVRANGEFGQYYWGPDRKAALISWEAAVANEHLLSNKLI